MTAVAVLSGNRNFEGRIHPAVRANFLASPPLVVAYALAGSVLVNLEREPLGDGAEGRPVYLRDLWPDGDEIRRIIDKVLTPSLYRERYATMLEGTPEWRALKGKTGTTYAWSPGSTFIRRPPFFEDMEAKPAAPADIRGARVLGLFGDMFTTDHISPIGVISKGTPAAEYLASLGVAPADFVNYAARRLNHDVMIRGTFANVRVRNEMTPGFEGSSTVHYPDGERMSIAAAAERYREEGVPLVVDRRRGVRRRLFARLGGKGHAAARRARGDRRELRAHPPLQPGRHGRAAAAVPGWGHAQDARAEGRRDHRHLRRAGAARRAGLHHYARRR